MVNIFENQEIYSHFSRTTLTEGRQLFTYGRSKYPTDQSDKQIIVKLRQIQNDYYIIEEIAMLLSSYKDGIHISTSKRNITQMFREDNNPNPIVDITIIRESRKHIIEKLLGQLNIILVEIAMAEIYDILAMDQNLSEK